MLCVPVTSFSVKPPHLSSCAAAQSSTDVCAASTSISPVLWCRCQWFACQCGTWPRTSRDWDPWSESKSQQSLVLSNCNVLTAILKHGHLQEAYSSWIKVCISCSHASRYLRACQRHMVLCKLLRWQENICCRGSRVGRYTIQRRSPRSPLRRPPWPQNRHKTPAIRIHSKFRSRTGRWRRFRTLKRTSGILQFL
jgi:hypothetical protein